MSDKGILSDRSADLFANFTEDEINKGVLTLIEYSDSWNAATPRRAERASGEHPMELIVLNERIGAVSMKPTNLVISWKKLLLSGGAIPVSYMSSTLTALTLLGALVKGTVHVFDEIDARILAVIHKNTNLLPASTQDFFAHTFQQFSPEINKALFMHRVVNLSGYGAISVDGDQLTVTEAICSINF